MLPDLAEPNLGICTRRAGKERLSGEITRWSKYILAHRTLALLIFNFRRKRTLSYEFAYAHQNRRYCSMFVVKKRYFEQNSDVAARWARSLQMRFRVETENMFDKESKETVLRWKRFLKIGIVRKDIPSRTSNFFRIQSWTNAELGICICSSDSE